MKRFFIFLAVVFPLCLSAQKKSSSKTVKPDVPSVHLTVFEQARLLGDVPTAISSLNYLIASEPTKYGNYTDTLAYVYFNAGYYNQCNMLSSILLTKRSTDEGLMALKAASLKQMNVTVDAAEMYSKLYSMTGAFGYGIELMQLQLSLERLPECLSTAQLVSKDPKVKDEKISLPKNDKELQAVSINAFVKLIEGLVFSKQKDNVKAKAAFEAALGLDPDFALAQSNLEALAKELGQ